MSHRPWLYFPYAEPGTKAILLSQSESHEMGLWPFVTKHRWVIRANGEYEDIGGGEPK